MISKDFALAPIVENPVSTISLEWVAEIRSYIWIGASKGIRQLDLSAFPAESLAKSSSICWKALRVCSGSQPKAKYIGKKTEIKV